MRKEDEALQKILRDAEQQANGTAPAFDTVYRAAERRALRSRRTRFAGLAAAAAIFVLLAVTLLPTQKDEFSYLDLQELTTTTSWTAPSDSLLPQRRFDIYRELPELIDVTHSSTKYEDGALL